MAQSARLSRVPFIDTGDGIDDCAFLLERLSERTLARARETAREEGTAPHEVLIAQGHIGEEDYHRRLADHCGLAYVETGKSDLDVGRARHGVRDALKQKLRRVYGRPDCAFALAPGTGSHAWVWRRRGVAKPWHRPRVAGCDAPRCRTALLCRTLVGVRRGIEPTLPGSVAAQGFAPWQRAFMAALLIGIVAPILLATGTAIIALGLALTVLFTPVVTLRLYALATFRAQAPEHPPRIPDGDLPPYTILVPMFREAAVLPDLIISLITIDWPVSKLDIKLVLEASDTETIAAARAFDLPARFEIVIVPDCQPRTKPKALNYALHFAKGDYLAIYDAGDRPEPGQLRQAHARFLSGPPTLACVQARLGFYNASENWMARQFELEYAALFDGLLPALERLGLPIPLGGTSNHFRVSALRWVQAWDAFNVTEDADLGMRLARHGYECAVISSRTEEEAPISLRNWTPQRTRWLKGYIQTWAVHMRKPGTLWRELKPRRFLGFQTIFGGMVLTSLVHPFAYLVAFWHFMQGGPDSLTETAILMAACALGATGYTAAMLLALCAAWARRAPVRAWQVLFMPIYWLLISRASWRAVMQLHSDPFLWEKTRHGVSQHEDMLPNRGQFSDDAEILTLH